jgi:hypothetical protein
LGTPNAYLKSLIEKMTDEMFGLILDPIYPPKENPIIDDSILTF